MHKEVPPLSSVSTTPLPCCGKEPIRSLASVTWWRVSDLAENAAQALFGNTNTVLFTFNTTNWGLNAGLESITMVKLVIDKLYHTPHTTSHLNQETFNTHYLRNYLVCLKLDFHYLLQYHLNLFLRLELPSLQSSYHSLEVYRLMQASSLQSQLAPLLNKF